MTGPAGGDTAPIIVTLQFDPVTQDYFESQRQAHFPAGLNRTPAHLTLFHNLPGDKRNAVMAAVGRAAQRPPFPVAVEDLMPLGRGVAFRLASSPLQALRADLARAFEGDLTRQDRERFRPHVTVQNKVTPATAKRTLELMRAHFRPFAATAEGIQLWYYRGGPWQPIGAVAFAA